MAGARNDRANEADQQAWDSALRPKLCLLAMHDQLRKIVASKLILDWSPKQISGWLNRRYPKDQSLRVSHETIYRSLFIQARGALKQELVKHLRSQRRIRRSRHSVVHGQSRGRIVDAISIRERPAEIEDRAVPGHWEGDLLRGACNRLCRDEWANRLKWRAPREEDPRSTNSLRRRFYYLLTRVCRASHTAYKCCRQHVRE